MMLNQAKRKIDSKFIAVTLIAAALFSTNIASISESKPSIKTIQDFYIRYLNDDNRKMPNIERPPIAMSNSFREAIEKNARICAANVIGPCGWGTDGDEYLATQETDPGLNYLNSGITFIEIEPDMVQVKLNVYPSAKEANGYYNKTITYKMVKENGNWVVDDVSYSDGISIRKVMEDENAEAIPETIYKAYYDQTDGTSEFKNIRILSTRNGDKTFTIKISNKWLKLPCDFQGPGEPYAMFADLNFDGNLDIWITGTNDGQMRSRCSDVWLFNPKSKKYEYNDVVSKIEDLEVSTREKILEGGQANCGCAAECFYFDIYRWQSGSLVKIARRKQDCYGDTIIYKEYEIYDGVLKVARQVEVKPGGSMFSHSRKADIHFLKWDSYPVGQR
jgi:hypothetical protein